MKPKLLLLSILLFCAVSIQAQYNAKASLGLGLIDVCHVGFEYQFKQVAIGGSLGFFPQELQILFPSLNYYYHFAGSSKYTDVKPWFGRVGLFYIREKTTYYIDNVFLTTVRIGRDFNFNERLGLSFDAGVSIWTFQYKKVLEENPYPEGLVMPVLPAFSIKLFYRFAL